MCRLGRYRSATDETDATDYTVNSSACVKCPILSNWWARYASRGSGGAARAGEKTVPRPARPLCCAAQSGVSFRRSRAQKEKAHWIAPVGLSAIARWQAYVGLGEGGAGAVRPFHFRHFASKNSFAAGESF